MNNYQNVSCVAPFSSLHISNHSMPCCVINPDRGVTTDNSKDIITVFHRTNDILRKEFLDAGTNFSLYKDCTSCSSRNGGSQNFDQNRKARPEIDYIKNPTLTYLHIKFSNKCNLACRTCDAYQSSMLYKGHEDQYPELPGSGLYQNIDRNSILFKSILDNLENIKYLWFSGGEPLLHDEVWEILELLYERNLIQGVSFQVNTNGTIKLTNHRIKILNSFKNIEIHISMDGIGKYAEYIRTGIIWDRWLENVRFYRKNIATKTIYITSTISAYNVHIADQILDFFDKENFGMIFNMVFNPAELCVYNISQQAKDYLNEKFKDNQSSKIKELLYFINHNPATISSHDMINYIDAKDNNAIQKNLYKNYIPFRELDRDWYNILKL